MSRYKQLVFSSIGLVLLVGAGYIGWQKFRESSLPEPSAEKPAAQIPNDTVHFAENAPQLTFLNIKPVEVFPEPLAEALNARLAYDDNHTARVYSPIAGRVLRIATEMGRWVKAGDPLLVIDSPDFAMAVADRAKADADLVRKKEAFERARQLLEVQGMARKDVESAEADLRQAEAEARRAKAHMENLNSSSLTQQGEFILRAPVSGIVSERQVNLGSEVRPDATNSLFVITNPKHLWLQVDVPERQIDKIAIGRPVSIEVDAYPNETFSGRISVIGASLDPVTRRIQVRCDVNNAQQKLKPEMFARVTPIADGKSDMPRIPNSSLVTQGLYTFLFVEKSPGVLQRRRVTLGTQDSEYSYVKEGLSVGERVVTSGALLINSELAGNN